MLPAFVIGLREGVEAALIVGIIAAFLRVNGKSTMLWYVLAGAIIAAVLCLGVGIGLHQAGENLPHKQQEQLETVVALVAVGFVTYMIVWMRRHAGTLRASLEDSAGTALAEGSGFALVGMAFFAVLREGLETAVFLVAAFNNSADPQATGGGAVLGLIVAVFIGLGIYGGGVKLDLSKFFRFTGLVLVLVAAGLVASAAHSGHEAGWVNTLQEPVINLEWLVEPGSIVSALVTGMFGIHPEPTQAELIGWALYLVPVGLYVAWPQRRKAKPPASPPSMAAGSAAS